jgi:hypothetical protein
MLSVVSARNARTVAASGPYGSPAQGLVAEVLRGPGDADRLLGGQPEAQVADRDAELHLRALADHPVTR